MLTEYRKAAVGQYAIQIARLHGMNVVTTCSPKNNDFVKERGAQHYFDYRDPEVVDKIRSVAPSIKYAFDTVGNEKSSATAAQALSKDGGVICTVRPGKQFTEGVPSHVKVTDVLVFTAFLKEHQYGKFHWPVSCQLPRIRTSCRLELLTDEHKGNRAGSQNRERVLWPVALPTL